MFALLAMDGIIMQALPWTTQASLPRGAIVYFAGFLVRFLFVSHGHAIYSLRVCVDIHPLAKILGLLKLRL